MVSRSMGRPGRDHEELETLSFIQQPEEKNYLGNLASGLNVLNSSAKTT